MNSFLKSHAKPLIIAHRGGHSQAPENSLAAYRNAYKSGADTIELDVRFTAERALYIMHDEHVDRTTNGHGKLGKMTVSQVQKLKLANNEHIPSLAEVLRVFSQNQLMVVELKNYTKPWSGLEAAVTNFVVQQAALDRVMFGSFIPWAGKKCKRVNSNAVFCWFFWGGTSALSWPWRRYIDAYGLYTGPKQISTVKAHLKRGHRVNSWVVNNEATIKKLIAAGITMITTDTPAKVKKNL